MPKAKRPKRPAQRFKRRPIKALAVPKAGDILRGEPNLIQAAAAAMLDMTQRVTGQYNKERAAAGLSRVELPGLNGSRNVTKKNRARSRIKAGTPRGVTARPVAAPARRPTAPKPAPKRAAAKPRRTKVVRRGGARAY